MLYTSSFTDDVMFSCSGPYGANGIVTLASMNALLSWVSLLRSCHMQFDTIANKMCADCPLQT